RRVHLVGIDVLGKPADAGVRCVRPGGEPGERAVGSARPGGRRGGGPSGDADQDGDEEPAPPAHPELRTEPKHDGPQHALRRTIAGPVRAAVRAGSATMRFASSRAARAAPMTAGGARTGIGSTASPSAKARNIQRSATTPIGMPITSAVTSL